MIVESFDVCVLYNNVDLECYKYVSDIILSLNYDVGWLTSFLDFSSVKNKIDGWMDEQRKTDKGMYWTYYNNYNSILFSIYFFSFLQKGDIIKILKQNENGVWEGEGPNGKKGHFPFKLVEVEPLDSNRL